MRVKSALVRPPVQEGAHESTGLDQGSQAGGLSDTDQFVRAPQTSVAPKGPQHIAATAPARAGELMVATYNVENLFDAERDPTIKDQEFTPQGARSWTDAKVEQKIQNLSQVIRAMQGGRGPDILALTEVENRAVVERLAHQGLQGLGYDTIAHIDGPDSRGIDCAIISRYPQLGASVLHQVHDLNNPIWDKPTRGILEATFDVDGAPLTVFANHWPSKRGGPIRDEQRQLIGQQLRSLIQSRSANNPQFRCVVLGDFNAHPDEKSLGPEGLGASGDQRDLQREQGPLLLYNPLMDRVQQLSQEHPDPSLTKQLQRHRPQSQKESNLRHHINRFGHRVGTHRHDSQWGSIDHIFLSAGLMKPGELQWVPGSFDVYRDDFMLGPDGAPYSFEASTSRAAANTAGSAAGISDHFPVVLRLQRKKS